jgi:hypothetical protein
MYEFIILLVLLILAAYRILAFPLWKGFKIPPEPVKQVKKRSRVVTTVPKP